MAVNNYINQTLDQDVIAFTRATGIYDSNITYIANLVSSFKSIGVWSKCLAIYPFIGDTQRSMSFNLKDISKYLITYNMRPGVNNNLPVFSSTGISTVTGNGQGNINTNLSPNGLLTPADIHVSVYSRTSSSRNAGSDIGTRNTASNQTILDVRFVGTGSSPQGDFIFDCPDNTTSRINYNPNNSGLGWFLASRTSLSDGRLYINGTQVMQNTSTVANTALATVPFLISGYNNNGVPGNAIGAEYAFATIGYGLTPTEASQMYTAIQTFQTSQGRQV